MGLTALKFHDYFFPGLSHLLKANDQNCYSYGISYRIISYRLLTLL